MLFRSIVQVGLASTTRDKVREDLLRRFATQQGMTYEQAEQLLIINENPPAATVVEPEIINVDPVDIEQATSDLRARNTQASGPYFWERADDVAFLDMFIALRRQAGLPANLLITGPSGTGKTEGVMRSAARHGIPFYKVDCASVTTEIGRAHV